MTGYRAAETLTASITDLALVGRALAAAVRDAREQAEFIAQAAGLRITGVERIVEEGTAVQPWEFRIAVGAPPAPIEPGLVAVTAQVSMTVRY